MEESKWNIRRLSWVCLGLAGVAGAAILYWFDPARAGFYPVCFFHQTTGLLCPGCGGLRAMHQLLHGHWAAAFALNPLVVIGLPLVAAICLRWLLGRLRHQPVRWELRPRWFWAGLALLLLFGIARNL